LGVHGGIAEPNVKLQINRSEILFFVELLYLCSMTQKENDIIKSLLTGGIIGNALGVLLSKTKGAGAALGALAGVAILASVQANENAQKTEIPLVLEEDDALYEVHSDGTKKLIKRLPKKTNKFLPKNFTLG